MRSFLLATVIAGASALAATQLTAGETGGTPTPQARPATTVSGHAGQNGQTVPLQTAPTPPVRVQTKRASCSLFGCRRMVLLGVAY